jgi:hypothetical protein
VSSSLCFAYGPTLILVLLPLFVLPTRWAWLTWNLVGAAASGWTVRALANDDGVARRWGRLALLGSTALLCLVNGQTALVTTGWFAAAMAARDDPRGGRQVGAVAGLVALSAKPPLAVIAAVALLVSGGVSAVVVAAAAIGAVLLVAASWWTPAVLTDYASLVAEYNLVEADPDRPRRLRPLAHGEPALGVLCTWGRSTMRRPSEREQRCVRHRARGAVRHGAWRRRARPRDVARPGSSWCTCCSRPTSASEEVLLVVPLIPLLRARR